MPSCGNRTAILWSHWSYGPEKRLTDRLTVIAEALDYVRSSGIVKPRRREAPHSTDMPLFDWSFNLLVQRETLLRNELRHAGGVEVNGRSHNQSLRELAISARAGTRVGYGFWREKKKFVW
jgi:hypothetical protein